MAVVFTPVFAVLARFKGVKGVKVVWEAGVSEPPDTLWTPATTDAAVAPEGAIVATPDAGNPPFRDD